MSGKKVYKVLEDIYGDTTFEDLDVPLYIGATDFSTGERVIISSGKIVDAVRASLSVPLVFEPFFHPTLERWLVDGGLSQSYPIDIISKRYDGNIILGIDVGSSICPKQDFSQK